ncbi:MFS transporter [Streptomyces sp. ISL-66]|uniref:MFS transporter n=1 Tax=Streptomyces sp. ISL-66 TaxID=2819186 RepID=UPI001BEC9158|nr:MFS transporter [Streptomyces sp. ISL-66]MBT2472269.1 MFS transporter [Streptomyces sp. ISL-66]
MYLADRSAPVGAKSPADGGPVRAPAVASAVFALGTVSLITDISSEMVTAVLPLYLVAGLGLSPLGFGALDGLYNGVSALVQLTGGHLADRIRNHKLIAGLGYGLSALCKPLLLLAHSLGPVGVILALERTGKGLRTAPRDALISLSTPAELQGRAFGVHRAMDTTGALLGPLAAFFILSLTVDGYDAVFGVSACVAVLGVVVLVLFVPSGADLGPARFPSPRRPSYPGSSPQGPSLQDPSPQGPSLQDPSLHDPSPQGPASPEASSRGPASPRPGFPMPGAVSLREAVGLLRLPRLRALAGCAALLGLTTVSDAFLYLLLQDRTGIGEQWFPLLPLGTAGVFLLLAVPAGALADRVGRRTVFLTGHALLLAGYGLLLLAPGLPALPYLVLALHGMFYAATDGVLPAAVAATVPAKLRATGIALVGTGQALARFCCSLALGAAWTVWGSGPALAAAATGLCCCAAVAGFVLRPAAPEGEAPDPADTGTGTDRGTDTDTDTGTVIDTDTDGTPRRSGGTR